MDPRIKSENDEEGVDYPIKSDNDEKEGYVDPPVEPEDDDNRRTSFPRKRESILPPRMKVKNKKSCPKLLLFPSTTPKPTFKVGLVDLMGKSPFFSPLF